MSFISCLFFCMSFSVGGKEFSGLYMFSSKTQFLAGYLYRLFNEDFCSNEMKRDKKRMYTIDIYIEMPRKMSIRVLTTIQHVRLRTHADDNDKCLFDSNGNKTTKYFVVFSMIFFSY